MSTYLKRFRAFLRRNEAAKGLFLVGIVLLAAVSIWGGIRLALNTEYPVLVVSSGSMIPTLMIGDLIVIRGQDPSSIVVGSNPVGSIIVFRPPNSVDPNYLVVHRAVGLRTPAQCGTSLCFITEGDNNRGNLDPWDGQGVPSNRIVGVYQYTIPVPYLGSAILSIRGFMYDEATGQPRPQGLAVIFALVAALFAFEVIEPSKKKKSAPSETAPAAPPPAPTPAPKPSETPGSMDS